MQNQSVWAYPNPTPNFSFTYGNGLSTSPDADILLGGPNAVNTVIRTYTGNGFAMGWISVLNRTAKVSPPDDVWGNTSADSYPDPVYANNTISGRYQAPHSFSKDNAQPIYEFSFNRFNIAAYNSWAGNLPPCGLDVFTAIVTPAANGCSSVKVKHHSSGYYGATSCPSAIPTYPLTSTVDDFYAKTWITGTFNESAPTTINFPKDDGIGLVQFNGDNMTSGLALANQTPLVSAVGTPDGDVSTGTFDGTSATKLANYKRPTTIVLNPLNHQFVNILFNDITWQYEQNKVVATTPTFISNLGSCNTGKSAAYSCGVSWDPNVAIQTGQTLVDAAVALQSNARVCVTQNVTDGTATSATSHSGASSDGKTDAIIVFPDQATGRFTFRVKGNISEINMAQDATGNAANNAKFYKQSDFPANATDIYLYPDVNNAHDYAAPHLGGFYNNNPNAFITNHPIVAPTDRAKGSIFGVYGSYIHKANNAEIHTDIRPGTFDSKNPGVIELGPQGLGRGHLHIYSGGTVKNFESCTNIPNFSLNFGGGFGTPDIKITADTTLFIMNYGNDDGDGCNAHIIFHDIANDTVSNAINGVDYAPLTQGTGPLRIQALSNVEFRKDETWTTGTTGKNNNLLILSDAGNVISQKITYDGGNAGNVAEGLLTFWAEDHNGRPGLTFGANCSPNNASNRNSRRGNIYMNDNVDIKRLNNAGTTETNVIAANNVRTATFKFESDNQDKNTTNIISRKGDLYLGYSLDAPRHSGSPASTGYTFNQNIFDYKVNDPANKGVLNIKAGYDDAQAEMTKAQGMEGGNIYFTQIKTNMVQHGEYPTNITIPYSSEYICGGTIYNKESLHNRKDSYQAYEHSGIIGGVGACGEDHDWGHYGGLLMDARTPTDKFVQKSLIYKGNNADLTVDAGRRGNIIMNTGASLDFDGDKGNAIFRTRDGDIDMRDKTDVTRMNGNLLFLAQLENLGDFSKIGVCGCDEERNNVYLQDFELQAAGDNGSVFIGADNNIKLNYGGLTNIGTRQDPFLSKAYEEKDGRVLKVGRGYNPNAADHCGTYFHCDLDSVENRARKLELFFNNASSGGFAAVASDMIDVYKDLIYKGGTGSGMGSVPGTGTLHGESVSGYGLFMKTQGNKKNWTANVFRNIPKCPTDCSPTGCGGDGEEATGFLHNTVRMTFHGEARFYAENQRVLLESPVIQGDRIKF